MNKPAYHQIRYIEVQRQDNIVQNNSRIIEKEENKIKVFFRQLMERK
jgi:hypothetical protein